MELEVPRSRVRGQLRHFNKRPTPGLSEGQTSHNTAFEPKHENCSQNVQNEESTHIKLKLYPGNVAEASISQPQVRHHQIGSDGMIGPLSLQEREVKVKRYLDKKRRRKLKVETIVRYECRKDLADNRYRLQGRFVKIEDIQRLRKEYIFDIKSRKLIKPIFKMTKIRGKENLVFERTKASSDEDASMDIN
jgi:hypothetical protein